MHDFQAAIVVLPLKMIQNVKKEISSMKKIWKALCRGRWELFY